MKVKVLRFALRSNNPEDIEQALQIEIDIMKNDGYNLISTDLKPAVIHQRYDNRPESISMYYTLLFDLKEEVL